jgi:hypothetical protein
MPEKADKFAQFPFWGCHHHCGYNLQLEKFEYQQAEYQNGLEV